MSEEEETKENERSREEERDFSEGMEYTQEREREQAQRNKNNAQEAQTKADDAFNRATAARDEKHKLQGQILGGKVALPKFTPEIARRTFNLVNTSEIDPPTQLNISNTSKTLDLMTGPFDPKLIDQVLNVNDKEVAKTIAETLNDLSPSERLQYLAERGTDDFLVDGFYNEYDPIRDVGGPTQVISSAKNVREVMKNARSLIEGKIAKFGNVSEIEINGAKYKVEGTAILKDGKVFLGFDGLQDTINNLSAATERLEQLERGGGSAADIETQRGIVAEERSAVAKFFDGITLKGLGQGILGIVALVFVITQVIALEHLIGEWVNARKKEISGCYLISSDVSDNLHDPKNTNCVSCASSTFKVSSCENPTCCTPFTGNGSPSLPTGFNKANENGPSYWNIGSSDVICNKNLNHPSYLSTDKCKKGDKDKPQLGADAVAEFLKRGINVPSTPLPLALWTQDGSVTYAIRSISSSDALVEVACDLEKTLCNLGSGVGNLILKIALPILIVCVLFYFVKFEYDKHDGKIKAKYRK